MKLIVASPHSSMFTALLKKPIRIYVEKSYSLTSDNLSLVLQPHK